MFCLIASDAMGDSIRPCGQKGRMLSHALAVVAVSWRSAVPAVAAGGVIFGRFVMPPWPDMFFFAHFPNEGKLSSLPMLSPFFIFVEATDKPFKIYNLYE